jgi:hypothetical protein
MPERMAKRVRRLGTTVLPRAVDGRILFPIIAMMLLLTAISVSAFRGGIADDGRVHIPLNYTNFDAPGKGSTFYDSAYGTRIVRVSDPNIVHEYSTVNAFNRFDTRALLLTSAGFFVIDQSGNVIVPAIQLQIPAGSNPRWSRTNSNMIYYFSGNRIMQFNLTTLQRSIVYTFSEYAYIDHGGGISDISRDNRMVFVGNSRYVGVFDLDERVVVGVRDLPNVNQESGVDISPSGNFVVLAQGVGDNRFEVYGSNMVYQRTLDAFAGHFDLGIDTLNADVVLTFAWSDSTDPPGCETGGVIKIRLIDGVESCIFRGLSGTHISSTGDTPWAVVTTVADNGTAGGSLPSDWRARWRVYENEIFAVRLDGAQVRRFVHHRTRTLDDYYYNPLATISRTGKWLMFSSNVGTNQPTQYLAFIGCPC